MRLADEMLLAQIRERLLSHIPDDQWKLVEQEVDKAGGVREVGGYTGVLLTDAISKASFGGDRSAAGRYAAEQRWKGHQKGGKGKKYPGVTTVVSDETFANLPKMPKRTPEQQARIEANLRALWAESDKRREGGLGRMGPRNTRYHKLADERRSVDRKIDEAKETLQNATDSQLRAGAGDEGRMRQYQNIIDKQEKAISDLQAKRDAISAKIAQEFPETVEGTPEFERVGRMVDEVSRVSQEANRREAGALRGLKDKPTYKLNVETSKAQIKRGDDGVARFRGSDLKASREQLKTEEDSLEAFESGKATSRQILGGRYNKTDTRAILQARVASARANVQALEEFEDETSPGYLSS